MQVGLLFFDHRSLFSEAKGKVFGSTTSQQVGRIAFETSKYGESSYRFVLKAPQPGEYGFVQGWDVFDFAVDPN